MRRGERVAHLVGRAVLESVTAEPRSPVAVDQRAYRGAHRVAPEVRVGPGDARLENAAPQRGDLGTRRGNVDGAVLLGERGGRFDIEPGRPVATRPPSHDGGRPSSRD